MSQEQISAAVAVAEKRIIVDEVVDDSEYRSAEPVSNIRISKTNRTHFNEKKLQELAESIKEKGVLQPILIRPVAPTEAEPQIYEIVAGERRYRASTIAGRASIPVMIRTLTDLQAAEIQILENLQREDPHPLEEAEGYERLMMNHGYNADQLADKVKKSRSYIYGRLKLCALAKDLRGEFLDEKFSASIALLVARIPVPSLQVRALQEIQNPPYNNQEPLSYREAVKHVQQKYMLDLGEAPFSITDAKLLATAGSCAKCPKRTGNQPEVFKDIDNADVCTDPDCFAEKKAAHNVKLVAAAYKSGIPVIEGKDAVAEFWKNNSAKSVHSRIYSFNNADSSHKGYYDNVGEVLPEKLLPKPIAYVKQESGEPMAAYDTAALQAALEKAGLCHSEAEAQAKRAEQVKVQAERPKTKEQIEREEKSKRAEDETKYRVELYKQVRQAGAQGFGEGALRAIVKQLLNEFPFPDDILQGCYPSDLQSDTSVKAYVDTAPIADVQLLMVDMLVAPSLNVSVWELDDEEEGESYQVVKEMALHAGIDPEEVRTKLLAPAPVSKPKKTARPKAKPVLETAQEETEDVNAWPWPTSEQSENAETSGN